jgi:outer membrane protein TolC
MARTGWFRVATFTVVGVAAFAVVSASAQDDRPAQNGLGSGDSRLQLTLEDAVRRALENNPDLAIVRLDAQVEAARVDESRGAFVPQFSVKFGHSSDVRPPSSFLLGDRGVDVNDWFSSTGLTQRLQWGGGTWSLSWDAARTFTNNPLTSFDPSVQSGFQVAFSQPLLRNRALDSARHQYIISSRNEQTSQLRLRETVVQTAAAVKQAYWTFKATLANVTVQQRSLELAQELVRQNKARVDIGQSPPLDLVQAEAEVAQRRETLIRATTAAGDAEDVLRRLIMDPLHTSFWQTRLDPVDDASGVGPLPDVDAAVTAALNGRYDLARARNDLANASSDVDFYRNQKLPDVRLEASYRGSGLGGTEFLRTGGFPGAVIGTESRGYGSVLNQVFTHDYAAWSFGVVVSYPLGNSYEEAGHVRARIERQQAAQRIASLQLGAVEGVRLAARQVHSTAERIHAARAGATLAEQRLATEQRRFEAGLSTSFLVTQAQRDLVQAQVNLLQATLDHQSSLVNFEALQLAPPRAVGAALGLRGAEVVWLPSSAPQGIFRQASGAGIP